MQAAASRTTKQQAKAPAIRFTAKLVKIGSWDIILVPQNASAKLPSRGMIMVKGTINGHSFQSPLEPDGKGSHWLHADRDLRTGAKIGTGDTVTMAIEPSKEWPEPNIPADLKAALAADAEAKKLWEDVTPAARWDWLRWIASTGREETRKKHVEVALSKLKNGLRRPCCFNRTMCTVSAVSKSGVLLDPDA
ncbi:MAG TPA: YdeI/OmpD-associated family protein [Candidatus Saccharimonadales bacterium]|nr:YdeI/OmpD-associated family protein [Candidatus Saccharimonadales bacterium]